ncbi:MAG: alkaline shock response membrane anchor protein AmaP [Verrucomicrobia bacterium]|nr:alkaline shock response membrane anchor protein AmaP [Verrucomicrobiota bacterium]
MTQPPYLYAVIGLITAILLWWLIVRMRAANRGIVPFKSSGGRVEIAPQTIKTFLQHVVSEADGVEKAHCSFKQKSGRLAVTVKAQVKAQLPLRTIESDIKRRIRSSMRYQFSMENIDPINIRITHISGQPIRPDTEDTMPLEVEQEPSGDSIKPLGS